MVSLPKPLNISCSCTECTIFLRPIPQRSPNKAAYHLNPFAAEYTPNHSWTAHPSWPYPPAPALKKPRAHRTSLVDKLSLSAYATYIAPSLSSTSSSSNSSRMSISTTSRPPPPKPRPISIPNRTRNNLTSKTKVLLRLKCTYEGCNMRIPVSSMQGLVGSALCVTHVEELRDCVREMVRAVTPLRKKASRREGCI